MSWDSSFDEQGCELGLGPVLGRYFSPLSIFENVVFSPVGSENDPRSSPGAPTTRTQRTRVEPPDSCGCDAHRGRVSRRVCSEIIMVLCGPFAKKGVFGPLSGRKTGPRPATRRSKHAFAHMDARSGRGATCQGAFRGDRRRLQRGRGGFVGQTRQNRPNDAPSFGTAPRSGQGRQGRARGWAVRDCVLGSGKDGRGPTGRPARGRKRLLKRVTFLKNRNYVIYKAVKGGRANGVSLLLSPPPPPPSFAPLLHAGERKPLF